MHAAFSLAPTNGSIALVWPLQGQPAVLDYLNYQSVGPDTYLGLFPDGQAGSLRRLFTGTPGAANDPTVLSTHVTINEWMALNSNLPDPADGHFDDWFELYNPDATAVDLSGYSLSDSLTNSAARWKIPPGTVVPAHGFLLVWADNDTGQNSAASPDLHAGFKLSQEGEQIGLFDPAGALVDSVIFGTAEEGYSQGRYPDGATTIIRCLPTLRKPNEPATGPDDAIALATPQWLSTGQLELKWNGKPGQTYHVQIANELPATAWASLAEVRAAGAIVTYPITFDQAHQRFYRVILPTAP